MSIIDSLSAGYRFLSKRLDLLLIPVLVDLFMWLAPRLSVEPLFLMVARFYTDASAVAALPTEMAEMAQQVAAALRQAGQGSNLLNALLWISTSLLHLPSLLYTVDPPRFEAPVAVSGVAPALLLSLLFVLIGIGIGVAYLLLLARQLPIGAATKSWTWRELPAAMMRHSLQIVGFVLVLVILFMAALVPISIGMALLSLLSPGITLVAAFVFGALMLALLLYLYFVPLGLILDGLRLPSAIAQSFRLVRDNFWSTLGLILLSDLISWGFNTLLVRIVVSQPLGTVLAIVVNAFIGSGIALAFMVYYRSRVLLAQGEPLQMEL